MPDAGHVPGPIVIPNCIAVRLIWTQPNTKTVYNVLHGNVAGGFTLTTAIVDAVFTAIKGAAGWTSWRARVNSGAGLAGVDMRDLRVANMPLVASTTAAAAGTGAGGAIPPGDAFCVTLRTASAGRGFRGRVYLAGLDFAALAAGGVAAAGTLTDAVSFMTAVQTALTASGITLAIAQPTRGGYTGTTGTVHLPRLATTVAVSSIVARNNIIDHQRRRAGRS